MVMGDMAETAMSLADVKEPGDREKVSKIFSMLQTAQSILDKLDGDKTGHATPLATVVPVATPKASTALAVAKSAAKPVSSKQAPFKAKIVTAKPPLASASLAANAASTAKPVQQPVVPAGMKVGARVSFNVGRGTCEGRIVSVDGTYASVEKDGGGLLNRQLACLQVVR